MARPRTIDEDATVERLSRVFRAVGYEGASLARLAGAVGLQRGSLYHRFPGGKQQMAAEVLAAASRWYDAHVFAPLAGPGAPAARVEQVARALDDFYAGGRQACLLNLMAMPPEDDSPFAEPIAAMFRSLIAAFAGIAREAGLDEAEARRRAERVVALLHGHLVLARGAGDPAPFAAFTASLGAELGVAA